MLNFAINCFLLVWIENVNNPRTIVFRRHIDCFSLIEVSIIDFSFTAASDMKWATTVRGPFAFDRISMIRHECKNCNNQVSLVVFPTSTIHAASLLLPPKGFSSIWLCIFRRWIVEAIVHLVTKYAPYNENYLTSLMIFIRDNGEQFFDDL